jgi:6-pyruvoyltetrahydropterin/6-carboxytetrahydropterin synthase
MFRLTREVRFAIDAAEGAVPERSPTNSYAGFPSLNGLGHYFSLAVTVAGELHPASNYLLNIKEIDQAARRVAIPLVEQTIRQSRGRFGAVMLGDIFARLESAWAPARLDRLCLALSPYCSISILAKERPMTRLSQKFEFAASHRLHNPAMSAEANLKTFGKCNNPHGHGHNYELQVTLAGTPDERSGLLVDVPEFERVVAETVINRFDHRNLNLEVAEFAELIPSVENIARVIYGLLEPKLRTGRTKLAGVTVWETPKTWCEYSQG